MTSAAGTPQYCRFERPFLGGREVVVARLIDPEPMRLEIGGDRQLRRDHLRLCAADAAIISAGRKCVLTITSHVRCRRNFSNRRRFSFSTSNRSRSLLCSRRRGCDRADRRSSPAHVAAPICQVQIGLGVTSPEGRIGEVEHVEVLHNGGWIEAPQCQLDGFGRA